MTPTRLFLLYGTLFFISLGCAPKSKFESLIDQGPLILSSDNPYIAQNLFLAKEAEISDYLNKFLNHRGAPDAIGISDRGETIELFYPKAKERYVGVRTLAESESGFPQYEWIIRGPDLIPRSAFRSLGRPTGRQTKKISEPPVFFVHGQITRFTGPLRQLQAVRPSPTPSPTASLRPFLAPKRKMVRGSSESKQKKHVAMTPKPLADLPTKNLPNGSLNSDAQALLISQGYAPRSPNGDLLHTINFETETLAKIAVWYTGSESTLPKIAQANESLKASTSSPLTKGLVITIPKDLVKNWKQMKNGA